MLRDIRKQYEFSVLSESDLAKNPFDQFKNWLQQAVESAESEPTAMVLSTVDEFQQPHARVVLLKEVSNEGLMFYTNYTSNKGLQINVNDKVALLFFWQSLERQVRITGLASKLAEQQSADYFSFRPVDSQLGAWASPQSKVIANHNVLDQRFEHFKNQFNNQVPKPPHWGGYLVKPTAFEFWQGRPNRLHDRFVYSSVDDDNWNIDRLAP